MRARDQLLLQLSEDMHTVKRLMQARFGSMLSGLGISCTQAHTLLAIDESQPLSLKALAAKMWLTPGAVTQLVDGLDQLKYIERAHDPHDRRIIYISLSRAGKRLIAKITRHHHKVMTDVLASLSDAEVRQFVDIQHKMTENLEALAKTPTTKRGRV